MDWQENQWHYEYDYEKEKNYYAYDICRLRKWYA